MSKYNEICIWLWIHTMIILVLLNTAGVTNGFAIYGVWMACMHVYGTVKLIKEFGGES